MITLEDLKQRLIQIINAAKISFAAKIKADKEVFNAIMFYTNNLNNNIKLKTRIYRIINVGIDFIPVCKNCGKTMIDRDIKNINDGYRKYCCQQCAKDSDARKELYIKTCIKRFGVKNASSSLEIKQKRSNTNMQRLGVDNPAKSDGIKQKIAKTNMNRYGCSCSVISEVCRKKSITTNIIKYGVSSYSKTKEYTEKTIMKNRSKFGVDYPNQDPNFRKQSQKRYTYKGIHFDSSPELAFYIYAEDHNINIEYQPNIFFNYEVNGRKFKYQPDFKVNGQYIEIKGLQFFENKNSLEKMINPFDRNQDYIYEAKHQCMLKNGIKIITDYSQYINYVKFQYGYHYLKSFKNK